MKLFIGTIALLVALVHAAPQGQKDGSAQIVSQTADLQPDGTFNYAFETDNGIKAEDKGTIKQVKVPKFDETGKPIGEDQVSVSVQTGSFSYTAPDGQIITLTYVADENGFQPQGAHLPVGPSV
ncbi:cuticle protein CP14.6-like [Aedes albopictus]|uniref:Pupal cuticle protein 78e n=1 Tax=Aedes albopictus TaxID=7160 RepID=A0ABM1ZD85_AEDAL|nr:cuticle protein CP14.6-like [Aedes albopictus]XP_029709541.1 cuticle protein CP14.6-like [Aedes albopictus]